MGLYNNPKVQNVIDEEKDTYVEYNSNNSGGSFWLSDDEWRALERAGWVVSWVKDTKDKYREPGEERWLGTLACYAYLKDATMREAIDSFQRNTNQNASDLGCGCCGPPHSFTLYKGGKSVEYYSPSAPVCGEEYDG